MAREVRKALVSHGYILFRKRGKRSGNFCGSRLLDRNLSACIMARIYLVALCKGEGERLTKQLLGGFTVGLNLVTSYWSCDNSPCVTEYCGLILCSNARTPVTQLVRTSDWSSEDPVWILAGSQCLFLSSFNSANRTSFITSITAPQDAHELVLQVAD